MLALRKLDPLRPPASPDEPHRTLTTQAYLTALAEWPWVRPATTVHAGTDQLSPPGRSGSHGVSQSANAIVLSERARARLQGFPDHWKWLGRSKASRSAMIGMAMPPPLAEAVASSVRAEMETTGVIAR